MSWWGSDDSSSSDDDSFQMDLPQWQLPSNFQQIKNIKLLNTYISDIKYIIKRNNQKIKIFNNIIIKSNNELDENIKKQNKRLRSNYNKKNGVCEKCAIITLSQKNLKSHKCGNDWYTPKDLPTLSLKIEVNELRDKIRLKSRNLKDMEDKNVYLNLQLDEVLTKIKEISLVCQNCNNNNGCVKNCECSYNHILCNLCIKAADKCPLCLELLNYEICPICMEERKHIIDVNCGNNHRICKRCINTILNTTPKCPFCRVKI
jgi:hypothetical protein